MGARQSFCLWADCLSNALLVSPTWLALVRNSFEDADGDPSAPNIGKGEVKDALKTLMVP